MTAHNKYFLINRDTLTQPIQMQLFQRRKTFSDFFSAFLKSILNFQSFQKKMTLRADVFPKLRTPKNVVRQLSKKSSFRGPLEKQHTKRAETLLKSEG